MLLALTRGLVRGHRGAWAGACVALAAAAAGLVLKGLDVEEAVAAAALLALLFGARRAFTRPGRAPVGWQLSVAVGVGAVAALGVAGSVSHGGGLGPPLTLGVDAEAARFSRTLGVAALVGGALLLRQALWPADASPAASPEAEAAAARFAARHAAGAAPLSPPAPPVGGEAWFWLGGPDAAAFAADPAAAGDAAALLRVHRRADTLAVLGEPVLAPGADPVRLLRALRERARDEDLDPVLHRLGPAWLGPLRAAGFTPLRLTGEGETPPRFLAHRSLWGGSHARVRAEAAEAAARRRP